MGQGRRAKTVAATLAVGLLLGAAGEAAANCVRASDLGAVQSRLVQTEMMVAALTCKRKDEYNHFVRKFQRELVARGEGLKTLFKRLHGGKSETRLNGFVTRLANEASMRSLQSSGFCQQAEALFGAARAVPAHQFDVFASSRASGKPHGLPVCVDGTRLTQVAR